MFHSCISAAFGLFFFWTDELVHDKPMASQSGHHHSGVDTNERFLAFFFVLFKSLAFLLFLIIESKEKYVCSKYTAHTCSNIIVK